MAALRKLRHTASLALALTAFIASSQAGAAYSCTLSITAISTVYSPTVPAPNDSTGSYTITCTRLMSDPANMGYWLFANNGMNPGGGGNRVALGGNFYNYEIYTNPTFTTAWGLIAGTLNFGAALSANFTGPFFLRVPGSQPVVPAGTYMDTVNATLLRSAFPFTVLDTSPLVVSVITTNSCQISVPPGNVSFTYTSFQAAPSAAISAYGVRCTTGFPYNMALDATSGTLLGLNYTLSVPAGSTGTGLTQSHTINGSIAAGQAGTCATGVCSGSQIRTLTISW